MLSAVPVRRTLGSLLHDSSLLMRRHFVQRAREVGLPIKRSEAALLVRVDHEPRTSQAQLAQQMNLDPIAVVRLIDSLQESGLIERRPHAHDRRIRTLWLTNAAQPVLTQVQAVAAEVQTVALEGIPEMEREMLLDLLVTVRSNLATASGRGPTADSPEGDETPSQPDAGGATPPTR
jgi:MarR family transcriptional regulator, transcriptional regulator for hemolysin